MSLSIEAEWERLDSGTAEEQACFAAIGIFDGKIALTEAHDAYVKRVRARVHLSAYKLAEWFAWNWWRLRWEPKTDAPDWAMAHRMTTIGGGFVWPNISIISDGERIVLIAKPTEPRKTEPLRYIADIAVVVRAVEFEAAVSEFIEQVQGQLRAEDIRDTNLDCTWNDICVERRDAESAKRRRLEALLGFDPDEGDIELLERLVAEGTNLGDSAVREIAATSFGRGDVPTAEALSEAARKDGFESRPADTVSLKAGSQLSPIGQVPAWKRGAEAAEMLRAQESLGAASISNKRLAQMSGIGDRVLGVGESVSELAFAIDDSRKSGHVVLRSKWETGRRFELARLLGDRIAGGATGRLFPATGTYTYRQKLQRSFAAELLCPFDAVEEMLKGDYSDEKQEECAKYFNVSPLTVRTLLINHGRIDRDDLNGDFESRIGGLEHRAINLQRTVLL